MEMRIGQSIAQLRHAKGVTQEALAQAVGVSAPAVSKWETGQSYPDIALLPPLARYFGVSVDALLAYRPDLTDEEREALSQSLDRVFEAEGWDTGLARCEAVLREYPTDPLLRILLAAGLMRNMVFAPDDAARQHARQRQLAWLKEAETHADGDLALLTRYQLGLCYLNLRMLDEAEALLLPLQEIDLNARQVLPTLRMLQGQTDEALRLAQRNLLTYIGEAVSGLFTLTALAIREEDPTAAVRYAEAGDALLTLFSLPVTYRAMTALAQMNAAFVSGDGEAMLTAAEQYAEAMLHRDSGVGNSPYFDRLRQDEPVEAHAAYDQALLRTIADSLETNEALAPWRETPRFETVLSSLRNAEGRHAE